MLNLPRIDSNPSSDSSNSCLNFAFNIIKDAAHRLVLKYMLIVKELLETVAVMQSKCCTWIINWSKNLTVEDFLIQKYWFNSNKTIPWKSTVKILSETKQVGFLQAQTPPSLMPLLFWIDWTISQGAIPSQESNTWGGRQQKATKNCVCTQTHTHTHTYTVTCLALVAFF